MAAYHHRIGTRDKAIERHNPGTTAGYPFLGEYKVDKELAHGHGPRPPNLTYPSYMCMRISGSNIVVDEISITGNETIQCAIGEINAKQPILPQQRALSQFQFTGQRLSFPDNAHAYCLSTHVKNLKTSAVHHMQLVVRGSDDGQASRPGTPRNAPRDDTKLIDNDGTGGAGPHFLKITSDSDLDHALNIACDGNPPMLLPAGSSISVAAKRELLLLPSGDPNHDAILAQKSIILKTAPSANAQKKSPHRPVYGSHSHGDEEGEDEEYYEEEEVSPGTTATAESGSSPTNTASTNSDPTKQQQQPRQQKNRKNASKKDDGNGDDENDVGHDDDDDDDEGVRYHHRDPNSPLKFGKQQQELKNMQLESDLRGLAHGKRMNPKAADAFLQRAVEIQQGRNIANGQQQENVDDGKSFTGSNHPLSKATPQLSQYLREAGKCVGGGPQSTVVLQREDLDEFNLQDYADKHRTLVAALEHKHAIKSQQYKLDDVAFYAEELMLTENMHKDGEDDYEQQQQGRISQNMTNNVMLAMNVNMNSTSARKQSPINNKKPTGMPLQDQTNQINNNNGGLISSTTAADDLMPATSKKPLVRRVDPVYERQKKLAGPQLHDHLCSDLLIPPMPSTVFFNDKVPNTKEPKSLVLPLPLPSTPLAF